MGWRIKKLTVGHHLAVSARLKELTRDEQRRLLVRARRAGSLDWWIYAPIVLVLIISAVALYLAVKWSPRPVPSRAFAAIWVAYAAIMVSTRTVNARYHLLHRHLAAEFPTLCPVCGYDRRATSDRCPECGAQTPAVP